MKANRQSNIEAIRILAMAFIVFGHISATLCNYSQCGNYEKAFLVLSHVGVCSVDLFILISGYFLIDRTKVNLNRVLKILVETVFYCFTITVLFYLFGRTTLYDCLSSLNPMAPTRFNYWFVTKYIGLMLLQPFLSRLAVSLSKVQYKAFLVVFTSVPLKFSKRSLKLLNNSLL